MKDASRHRNKPVRSRARTIAMTVAVGIAAVAIAGGCGKDERRKIIVFSPHGKEILKDYKDRFEALHPEIEVQTLYLASQIILDRLLEAKSTPICDVWWGAPSSMFEKAAEQHLLEPYKPSWHVDPAPSGSYDEQGHSWHGTFLSPEVIFFNKDTLSREEAPKDWDELLSPKWKDKIVLRYPMESGTMRSIFSAMIWRDYKDSLKPEVGYAWLRNLHANVKQYPNSPEQLFQTITRSRTPLVSMWLLSDIELQRTRYQYPFDYVIPPKTPVLVDGVAIVARAIQRDDPRVEDARLFYEFITSKDSTIRMAQPPYFRIPTRTDIPKEELPDWMNEVDWTEIAMDVDWGVVAKEEAGWMTYWRENIHSVERSAS